MTSPFTAYTPTRPAVDGPAAGANVHQLGTTPPDRVLLAVGMTADQPWPAGWVTYELGADDQYHYAPHLPAYRYHEE